MWFDQSERARVEHLELLADYEGISLDDLLDEGLTQKQVLFRLRLASGDNIIPPEVLERRRQRHLEAQMTPVCRICVTHGWECEGRITRHHFVPNWLIKQLENSSAYSARSINTIPICLGRHRDLHLRTEGDKSIVPYLTKEEGKFAHKVLSEFREEHPKVFDLFLGGESSYAYEAQLAKDYIMSNFLTINSGEGIYDRSEDLYGLQRKQTST